MGNRQHGWVCPTCGTERSECDVGAGTVVVDGPVITPGPWSTIGGPRLTHVELLARNSAMVAAGRSAADGIRCTRTGGHRFVSVAGRPDPSSECLDCGLRLLPEPTGPARAADLTPTWMDARSIPCDENHATHFFRNHGRTNLLKCAHCNLLVRHE